MSAPELIPPRWATWLTVNGRPELHLWGEDPRRLMSWKGYWEPRVMPGSPFELPPEYVGVGIDPVKVRFPAPVIEAPKAAPAAAAEVTP